MFRGKKNPLALAMIQPEPMPGSFRNRGMTFDEVMEITIKEVQMLKDNGFDGYIIQNRNDAPVKQKANVETIAYYSVLAKKLNELFPDLVQGILINWDGLASLAVAEAAGSDFIRVEHTYTGVEVGYAGMLEAECVDLCYLRKRLDSKIMVFADVQEINYEQIGGKSIVANAWDTVMNAFADGLFLGGRTAADSIQNIKDVRARLGDDIPIMLSGGSTGDNVTELLKYYDGVSVGSWVKNGNMKNPIDEEKAKIFMEAVRKSSKE